MRRGEEAPQVSQLRWDECGRGTCDISEGCRSRVKEYQCGTGILTLYSATEDRVVGLNFGGRAPLGARIEVYNPEKKLSGPMATLVPGTLVGWLRALEDYGTLSRSRIFQCVIELARTGFPLSRLGSDRFGALAVASSPGIAGIYQSHRRPPKRGDTITAPNLAKTYERIAREGLDAFYGMGLRIAHSLQKQGGLLSDEDLSRYPGTVNWVSPIRTKYRESTVYAVPPPSSGGLQVLQTLNIVENFDLGPEHRDTAEYLRIIAGAIRLARVDSDRFVADPEFSSVPTDRLLSKRHAHRQSFEIDIRPERPVKESIQQASSRPGCTTHLTVVDRKGNAVSLTQTLGSEFGCGTGLVDSGIVLNNGMYWFSLNSEHLNAISPYKAQAWPMAPILTFKDGVFHVPAGVMGYHKSSVKWS
jgi:gamma-glutamyltranspeptidase